ncbi:MAG TPA: hypothetical protein VGB88_11585, partial [Alphaproteobacteria bacterium]
MTGPAPAARAERPVWVVRARTPLPCSPGERRPGQAMSVTAPQTDAAPAIAGEDMEARVLA